MFGMMIPNDSCFSGVAQPPTTNLVGQASPSHGQDVVGVPDGDRHVPPEDVAEKLQMAEATVGIWPAGADFTGLPRCGFS